MSNAAARLDASRARLRESMQGRRRARRAAPQASAESADPGSWLSVLDELPIVGPLLQSARSAWRDSPLPAAVSLAEEAGNEALRPTAERHPLALVGIAMAGGALIAWAQPWRTAWRAALAAGVVSQLSARLVAQIPVASLVDAVSSLAARREERNEPQEGLRHSG